MRSTTKAFIGIFVRSREVAPGVGETIDGSRYDADADQQDQAEKPPGVKDVSQSDLVQDSESLRRVGTLHLVRLGDRPLQHDRSDCRKDYDEDQKHYPGLDGSNSAPHSVRNCAGIS